MAFGDGKLFGLFGGGKKKDSTQPTQEGRASVTANPAKGQRIITFRIDDDLDRRLLGSSVPGQKLDPILSAMPLSALCSWTHRNDFAGLIPQSHGVSTRQTDGDAGAAIASSSCFMKNIFAFRGWVSLRVA